MSWCHRLVPIQLCGTNTGQRGLYQQVSAWKEKKKEGGGKNGSCENEINKVKSRALSLSLSLSLFLSLSHSSCSDFLVYFLFSISLDQQEFHD